MDGDPATLLARARPGQGSISEEVVRALNEGLTAARALHPALAVPVAALIDRIAPQLPEAANETVAALARLHLADLYLASGCVLGLRPALETLEAQFLARIPQLIAHLDHSEAFADEVKQELRRKLLVGELRTPPSLTRYQGRGPLHSFIAIAAQRVALDLLRARGRVELVGDGAELERRLSSTSDPELHTIKAGLQGAFAAALRSAVQGLEPRERMILRLTLVSGLPLEKVGALYGVNASTVCRWLARTRARLGLELRRHLSGARIVDPAEMESAVRVVQSGFDIGLSSLLGADATLPASAGGDSARR